MHMSNFENIKKNIRNTVAATVFTMTGVGAMAAETPKESLKDESKTETNFEKPVASPEATAGYAAERIAHIKKLEQQIESKKEELRGIEGGIDAAETDFMKAFHDVEKNGMDVAHKKHDNLGLLPSEIKKMTMELAREKVAEGYDVTDAATVNSLLAITLSRTGPFPEEATHLSNLLLGQLGSTVAMNNEPVSEDIQLHQRLGTDPRTIVELSLKYVQLEHELNGLEQELSQLMASSETAGN